MPSMKSKLDWIDELEILYDASSFDTDPFEQQPKDVGTLFPFEVEKVATRPSSVELPYTVTGLHTLHHDAREKHRYLETEDGLDRGE